MQILCFFQPPLISRLFYTSVVLFCFLFSFNLRHFFRYARAYVRTGSYAPVNHGQNLKIINLRDQARHDSGKVPFTKTKNMPIMLEVLLL